MSHSALVVNIQRFSLHDGPGVRTTIFFKGCPLKCLWCHNPESRAFQPEVMFYAERCTHCRRCDAAAPAGGDEASRCEACAFDARVMVGTRYTAEALFEAVLRDQGLYDSTGGGVTLSGGEVMAQDGDFLVDLLTRFKKRGIRAAIDTCGFAPWAAFERILPLADLFLYDLKALTPEKHRLLTGADNALILDNFKKLAKSGADIRLRVPVVPGANAEEGEMRALAQWAYGAAGAIPVHLLPYHRVGSDKAERLGEVAHSFDPPSGEMMDRFLEIWRGAGYDRVLIGG